jgi:ferredoxin
MRIDTAKLLYFSPTQTTGKIVEGIGRGLGVSALSRLDLTGPEAAMLPETVLDDALVVLGAPVYAGRLPVEAVRRLRRFRGSGLPAVIVVVYGNRAYEDALLELRDLAVELGFIPVAAGAFVGEHSYCGPDTPIAVGRPDAADLAQARGFGAAVAARLGALPELAAVAPIGVPGNFPYKENGLRAGVSPAVREEVCAACGQCVAVCPMAAIRLDPSPATDKDRCIRCCACVKVCQTGARVVDDPGMLETARRLAANCRERREPETFL